MDDEMIRRLTSKTLRVAARSMFEDDGIEMHLRSAAWVDSDSYDAGVLDAAKFLLRLADQIETEVGP